MQLAHYLQVLHRGQGQLAAAYRAVAEAHQGEVDVYYISQRLARQADDQAAAVEPFLDRYQRRAPEDPPLAPSARFGGPRGSGLGLLRDLQELYLIVAECDICWLLVDDAAQGARDTELLAQVRRCHDQSQTQLAWLRTQLSQAAVQTLVVA